LVGDEYDGRRGGFFNGLCSLVLSSGGDVRNRFEGGRSMMRALVLRAIKAQLTRLDAFDSRKLFLRAS
jgi:hypothetical protein